MKVEDLEKLVEVSRTTGEIGELIHFTAGGFRFTARDAPYGEVRCVRFVDAPRLPDLIRALHPVVTISVRMT